MFAWLKRVFGKEKPVLIQTGPDCGVVGSSREYCTCPDWTVCHCGTEPLHCQWCCGNLTPNQLLLWDFEKDEKVGTPPCVCPLKELDEHPNVFYVDVQPECLRHNPPPKVLS